MKKYTDNYLKVVSTVYAPNTENLKFIRGVYMINSKTKYKILKELGSDAWVLYEYFYEHKTYKHFAPTADTKIGSDIGWSHSKVARVKGILKTANLLLILKDTVKDGTIMFRTVLDTDLILHYKEHSTLPDNVDIQISPVVKD